MYHSLACCWWRLWLCGILGGLELMPLTNKQKRDRFETKMERLGYKPMRGIYASQDEQDALKPLVRAMLKARRDDEQKWPEVLQVITDALTAYAPTDNDPKPGQIWEKIGLQRQVVRLVSTKGRFVVWKRPDETKRYRIALKSWKHWASKARLVNEQHNQ
jgi:hypothetical protein